MAKDAIVTWFGVAPILTAAQVKSFETRRRKNTEKKPSLARLAILSRSMGIFIFAKPLVTSARMVSSWLLANAAPISSTASTRMVARTKATSRRSRAWPLAFLAMACSRALVISGACFLDNRIAPVKTRLASVVLWLTLDAETTCVARTRVSEKSVCFPTKAAEADLGKSVRSSK